MHGRGILPQETMNGSMQNYLRVATPYLHPELASPKALSHIGALGQILPPFSRTMLEFRLGAGQSQVDLSVFFLLPHPESTGEVPGVSCMASLAGLLPRVG
jgi:hypothetical protein